MSIKFLLILKYVLNLSQWNFSQYAYLVSDLDEHYEYGEDEHIVSYTQSSDDDVDDFEYTVTDVGEIIRRIIVWFRRRCDVLPNSSRQRCVLHRCYTRKWST